jgi:hypothetical protein
MHTLVVGAPKTQLTSTNSCCIDKTSTAELSEAINSMFRWYREARVCYAYLTDVQEATQLADSRWFTRGWTLQELVAPSTVWFYTRNWQYLGSKVELQQEIQRITDIETKVLTDGVLETVGIARRMSWAAKRQTTRIEDLAYSLMGIFDINMPLLYGEGKKAFTRLQEEIMKTSDDQSLFAWGIPADLKTMQQFLDTDKVPNTAEWRGIFADSPSEFTHCDRIHVLEDVQSTVPPIVSNKSVRIELQLKEHDHTNIQFAVIYCTLHGRYQHYLGFPVIRWGGRWVARCGELVTVPVADLVSSKSNKPFIQPTVLLVKAPVATSSQTISNDLSLEHILNKYKTHYVLEDVHCSTQTSYSRGNKTLTLSEDNNSLHAVFYFICAKHDRHELFPGGRPTLGWNWEHMTEKLVAEKRNANSFEVTTKTNRYGLRYEAVYPTFALLVGGWIGSPWVEAVTVLEDEDTEAEFKALHMADARMVRSCTTRHHLSSLLSQKTMVRPLRGSRSDEDTQLIMCYSSSCQKSATNSIVADTRLQVNARLKMVTRNLVQRGLVLFVEVTEAGCEMPERKEEQERWWALGGVAA